MNLIGKVVDALPPFVKVKAFWEMLSLIVAGVLGLLALFHVIPLEYALAPGAVLTIFLGILRFFNIHPELRLKELIEFLDVMVEDIEREAKNIDAEL